MNIDKYFLDTSFVIGLIFSNDYHIEYNDATNNLDNSHIYYFVLDI